METPELSEEARKIIFKEEVTKIIAGYIDENNRHARKWSYDESNSLGVDDILLILEYSTDSYWYYFDKEGTFFEICTDKIVEGIRKLVGETTFSKIINNETPSNVILENLFLDSDYDFKESGIGKICDTFDALPKTDQQ